MPIHRIPRATMHEDLHSVEREGERVVSVAPDGPDHVLVGTVMHGWQLEQRYGAAREQPSVATGDVPSPGGRLYRSQGSKAKGSQRRGLFGAFGVAPFDAV
jgi:hypothetical protein